MVKRPLPSGAKRPQANTGNGRFAPFVNTTGNGETIYRQRITSAKR